MTRPVLLAVLAAVVLSACGARTGTVAVGGGDDAGACEQGQRLHDGLDPVASAPRDPDAEFPWDEADPPVLDGFDATEIIPGGPPPDGIRPIDAPCFEDVEAASAWLEPRSPVLVLEIDGDARAYPLAILTRHEIVNDVVAGTPVTVTYCPLCNSGIAFERVVDGDVLDFGTSGRLYRANLVMYDRQSRSLWSQFRGEAVVGDAVGTRLPKLPVSLLSWEEFAGERPDGAVLARPDGRGYGNNPYVGYEDQGVDFLFRGPQDDRLGPQTRVVGVSTPDGSEATAVTLDLLRDQRVVDVDFDGAPLTVWWAPGAASAVDTASIDDGRDVGQSASFRPVAPDGTRLHFSPADDPTRFVDDETASTWNLLGEAVDGPLAGATLQAVPRDDTFWFVWFAFRPATVVVGG